MAGGDPWRYERKFPIESLGLAEVESLLREHPACFSTLYPSRWINSIYCESPGMDSFMEHVAGVAGRVKARIRWYGSLLGQLSKPLLELKIKQGLAGRKEYFPMAPFRMTETFHAQAFRGWVKNSKLPADIRSHLLSRDRLLMNRYCRRYYATPDKRFRATLDDQLQFFQPHQLASTMTRRRLRRHLVILELKYARELDGEAERVTGVFPFRVGRVSKYITAVEDLALL